MSTRSETATRYKLCQLGMLDHGLVEMVFVSSSMAAIDQFFAQVEPLIAHAEPDAPLLLLVNTTKAPTLPIIYAVQQVRAVALRQHDKMHFKCAVVSKVVNKLLSSELDHLTRSLQLTQMVVSFFPEQQREQAITWLSLR